MYENNNNNNHDDKKKKKKVLKYLRILHVYNISGIMTIFEIMFNSYILKNNKSLFNVKKSFKKTIDILIVYSKKSLHTLLKDQEYKIDLQLEKEHIIHEFVYKDMVLEIEQYIIKKKEKILQYLINN